MSLALFVLSNDETSKISLHPQPLYKTLVDWFQSLFRVSDDTINKTRIKI
jgi:hypothetical protein